MKYHFLLPMMVAVILVMASCGKDSKGNAEKAADDEQAEISEKMDFKASLKSDIDSLNYMFGVGTSSQLTRYLQQEGVDSTLMKEVLKGIRDGFTSVSDEKQKAYEIGRMIGYQSAGQLNESIFLGYNNDKKSLQNFMAGILDGSKKDFRIFDPTNDSSNEQFHNMAKAINDRMKEKCKQENEQFVRDYAKGKDVIKLPSGVCYKVLKEGKGSVASASSDVTIRYEGKTIDGKVFDSNMDGEPATMFPSQVIPGFGEVLKTMPAGSKWEVCIPQDQAYGEQGAPSGKIKPYSTLIFTIEVLSVDAAAEAPAEAPAEASK